jgi:type IV secretory pathway TraG/TraD family ATPase VirD4
VLGVDEDGRRVHLGDDQLSAHGLILGASGSGKTTTLLRILGDRIAAGQPVVVLDMKGSPAVTDALAGMAARSGRRFLCWTPDGPALWNPLQHGNATELKDKLIAAERFTEPHYQRAAERYLQTALQVLHARRPQQAATLDGVVAMMEPSRLSVAARVLPAPRAEAVQDYLATLTADALSAIRGLGTRLALLSESHTGAFLSPRAEDHESRAGSRTPVAEPRRQIDLHAALSSDAVVLFSLNASRYGKLAAQLGTMIVQDLVGAAGRRLQDGGPHPRAVIALDEFSALGADQVLALFARAREADVCVLVATQELSDLDRAAAGLRDQVLGNTAVKIAHRQDVPASASVIAQLAGTETRWEVTERLSPRPTLLPRRLPPPSPGTRRRVEQFLVHPNEIKRLRTGEAVLITKLPETRVQLVRVHASREAER